MLLDSSSPYHGARRPDFLVISPPKTGSTWLADNLRCHPQLFVPAIKEVKYFSSLCEVLDFGWYCDHFAPAGARLAGEASPSYASLPLAGIRRVRSLLPGVKLVFLMRDPVSRAWSHAKHNRRYREANFVSVPPGTEVTDAQWRANFAHGWPLVNGDYLGQLRRWSSVFPKEQLFVGFYESIATRPVELLRDVFRFLGADPDVNLSGFPVTERILAGPPGELPANLAPGLRGLLRDRTEELAEFLHTEFGLSVPPEWEATLRGLMSHPQEPPAAFRADDDYLSAVMRSEATFVSGFRLLEADYRGYDLVVYAGKLYGVARAHGPVSPAVFERPLPDAGEVLIARTLPELKERITTHLLERTADRLRVLEEDLRAAREQTARLTAAVSKLLAPAPPSLANRALRVLRVSARRVGSRAGLLG